MRVLADAASVADGNLDILGGDWNITGRRMARSGLCRARGAARSAEGPVLTLTIPVAETAKPRRVQVGGSSDAQSIEPQAAGGA